MKINVKENLYSHSENELNRAGLLDKDADYGGMIGRAVLELMKTFSKQGHSGFSAQWVRELFNKLSNFETLTPITDDPNEWTDVSEMGGNNNKPLWQNKRNPAMFSNDGGKIWWNVDDIIIKEGIKLAINNYKILLSEVKVNIPLRNHLAELESLKSQIESTSDENIKRALTIKCAELVLPIWNKYYPNDKRPENAIKAAKQYLADPTQENRVAVVAAAYAAYAAYAYAYTYAYAAAASAAAYAAYAAYAYAYTYAYAADTAIKATKIEFKLNENMKNTNKIKDLIKAQIKEILTENEPKKSPSTKPVVEPDVMEPDVKPETKPKRRTLEPPKEAPETKPKALKESEKNLIDKIAQRFKNLKK